MSNNSIMSQPVLCDARSRGLAKPAWILLGLAALGAAVAWAVLYSADGLNADTPYLEIPFFASLATVLLAVATFPVELVLSARRPREVRASRGKRVLFHMLVLIVLLAGGGSAALAVMAMMFPTC